jgi:hypothetical protein
VRGPRRVTYTDFRGGVNALDAVYDLPDQDARDARNMVPTTRGAIRKRDGSQVYVSLPGTAQSIYASQSPNVCLIAASGGMYSVTPAKTVTALASGLTNGPWSFVNAPANGGQGPLWGANGAQVRHFTGTSFGPWTPTAGTVPIARHLVYMATRVFAAGMSTYGALADAPSAVLWSNLGNPRDWPAANVVELDPNDGEAISGLSTLGSYLLVCKPSKAWLIYDLDVGANRRLGSGFGCIAPRSMVETPFGVFMLSPDQGVMIVTEGGAKRISDKILPFLRTLSPAALSQAAGAWFNQHYYLAVSSAGAGNDLLLDYDVVTQSWWIHTLNSSDLTVWQPGTEPLLFDVSTVMRRLFVPGTHLDSINADGTGGRAYTSYYKAPYHALGRPEIRKRIREMRIDGQGRARIYMSRDFQQGETLMRDVLFSGDDSGKWGVDDGGRWGVDDGTLWGGQGAFGQQRIPTPGVGRAWSPVFLNDTDDPLEIDSYTIAFSERTN